MATGIELFIHDIVQGTFSYLNKLKETDKKLDAINLAKLYVTLKSQQQEVFGRILGNESRDFQNEFANHVHKLQHLESQ